MLVGVLFELEQSLLGDCLTSTRAIAPNHDDRGGQKYFQIKPKAPRPRVFGIKVDPT